MKRRFYTLDVFTREALSGNPLAVVLDSEGLDDARMQKIALEFNLSETVFVSPATDEGHCASIRIFTPAHELPFAGHPTVGTAILLNLLNHFEAEDEFVLEERVGPVRCVISDDGVSKTARFGLPKIPEKIDWDFDFDLLAAAMGIDVSSIIQENVELWSGGVPYTLVPVKDIVSVAKSKPDTALLEKVEPVIGGIGANPYVFCMGGEETESDMHARMFAPLAGIPEDPATGSAVAALSGWIGQHVLGRDESRTFRIEQGYEMGRPSQIVLDVSAQDGKLTEAWISGSAVIVSEGILHY